VIEELLPSGAECSEEFGDPAEAALFPEEEAAVARAVGKRRREFGSARNCAREALGRLGVPPAPILPGERGAPQWPDGVVGSITHCAGYRAAVVARARDLLTVGIDAEPAGGALPHGVLDHVSLPVERAMLGELSVTAPGVSWERLLFSAKESVYKAWFPLSRRWLGFEDAEITIGTDGTFGARLLVPGGPTCPTGFTGRWLARNGLVVTAITTPA
jgi:enterobactin synthetase component D / holo-[acyl-carrier protein] synthase